MDRAEQRGDHDGARALARSILVSGERAIAPASDGGALSGASAAADPQAQESALANEPNEEASARKEALELLARTEPDPFLLVVGMLGLGLTLWLVYTNVL